MSDYIKREDAIEVVRKSSISYLGTRFAIEDAIEDIPAADVVEVVRCKDCKWCHSGYCEMYDDLIPFGCANRPWEEWFCADGTRMDGDA